MGSEIAVAGACGGVRLLVQDYCSLKRWMTTVAGRTLRERIIVSSDRTFQAKRPIGRGISRI
jgi:hypothetical protein